MTLLAALRIESVAFWSARLPGWDVARAVIRGEQPAPDAAASRPAASLLAATERRRAPDTVVLALEVAQRACEAADRDPKELPSIFASTHGDVAISDYMCATLVNTPTLISPIRFHNSVHNAAAGYWSIGTGSYAPYTAISAFKYTFAAGLLEAASQALCEHSPVLYVAFDIESKGPLATVAPSRGLMGVALIVSPASAPGRSGAAREFTLNVQSAEQAQLSVATSAAAQLTTDNALAPSMPFIEALARDEPGAVTMALSPGAVLHADVSDAQSLDVHQ